MSKIEQAIRELVSQHLDELDLENQAREAAEETIGEHDLEGMVTHEVESQLDPRLIADELDVGEIAAEVDLGAVAGQIEHAITEDVLARLKEGAAALEWLAKRVDALEPGPSRWAILKRALRNAWTELRAWRPWR